MAIESKVDLCLIILPSPALRNPVMYTPLGILYIASSARLAGFTVDVVDFRREERELPAARYYGFSCTTPEIYYAKKIRPRLKGKTIIGGPHPTLLPEDCLDFDVVVRGEGENIIKAILAGRDVVKVITEPRILNLDEVAFPDWDEIAEPFTETLFPGERYGMGAKAATMILSRGCPYHCSFCANMLKSPVVYRGVDDIMAEVCELVKRGVHYFRFEDDNITVGPNFHRLMDELGSLRIKFKCHTRSNRLSESDAQMLKAAGCEECGLGVESCDDHVLKLNQKGEEAEAHYNAVRILKKYGLRAKTYFMAGLPGETDESIELNKKFMREAQPDKWTLSCFTPYPGCDIFHNPDNYGIEIMNYNYFSWWNFVVPEKGIDLPGREGFNHVLNGQTIEQMTERHNKFFAWLLEESNWKK